MKTICLFRFWILLLFVSCNGLSENDTIKKFIPGTYIRFSQHEYGTIHDTVVINLLNESANVYTVTANWRYDRILDGKPIEPEYKNHVNSAIYNEDHKLLQVTETGEVYSFDKKENALYAGSTKFQKLK